MQKRYRLLCAAALIVASIAVAGQASAAEEAEATADVNMRDGPGTGYFVTAVIPRGAYVSVHGCDDGRIWCEASWRGHRGWVYSAYLAASPGAGGVPFDNSANAGSGSRVIYGYRYYWYQHYDTPLFYDHTGLYNPLEGYRNEFGSSYYHQHRR